MEAHPAVVSDDVARPDPVSLAEVVGDPAGERGGAVKEGLLKKERDSQTRRTLQV